MKKSLNKYFDHTLLKPDASEEDIKKLCQEATEYEFFSVCVNGCHVKYASSLLKDTPVKVTAVCGFPLGASSIEVKTFEAWRACLDGASEVDMVINIGRLKSGDYEYCEKEISSVVNAAKEAEGRVKVIIETCLLNDNEIVTACKIAERAGAAFVKTSTGFSTKGASVEDISLIKKTVGDRLEVKASGGIRDYKTAIAMIEAGADRLGASASVSIMKES